MSSNIVPFNDSALPASIVNRKRILDVNKDVVYAAQYPTLSIKGKVFTLVKDSERKVLTKPDNPDEVLQFINMVPLRITMTNKVYYAKKWTEDDSEGQRPDCFSHDGIAPSPNSPNKQADKCAVCPHNVWGSRVSEDGNSKGKECNDNARIAVADPRHLDKPFLLRVPPKSLKPLRTELKLVKNRGLQYNEAIIRIGFNREEPSPVLTFKAIGVLDDASYEKACDMFESEVVHAIVGGDPTAETPAPNPAAVEPDELDAALTAREATRKAAGKAPSAAISDAELGGIVDEPAPVAAKPKAPAKPKAATTPAPPPAQAAQEPAEAAGDGDLLGDIEDILGNLPLDD